MSSSIEIKLEGSTLDAWVARRAVMHLIGDESSVEFVSDAMLITSELVTNATMHSDGPGVLRAEYRQQLLRVEVTDGSDALPEMTADHYTAAGGRGLRLVNDLATRWGVRQLLPGKTMWFELTAEA